MGFDERKLYNDLVEEICNNDCPKYDSLVIFVHNFLSSRVKSWCYNDSFLRWGTHYEDVMQEIQIRIIKKCERYFFDPQNGIANKTCEEFKAWCYKVAQNYFFSYCVKQKNRKEVELDLSIKLDDEQFISGNTAERFTRQQILEESRSNLKTCFAIVMDLKSSPHIILTWLSVSMFMLECDASRIESTHIIIQEFSKLTLFEMFYIVISSIQRLGWEVFTEEQIAAQREKLTRINKESEMPFGDMKYEDFYMSKGPEMSISDWVNRVNSQIKKQISVM